MFDTEPMKPLCTGRPSSLIFCHRYRSVSVVAYRTAAGAARSGSPTSLGISPWSYFRPSCAGPDQRVLSAPPSGNRRCLSCSTALDRSAANASGKSLSRDALPIISVDLSRISAYHLREARTPTDNIVPRKWPSLPCWIWPGDARGRRCAWRALHPLRTRYLAGKPSIRSSITAGQVENV